MNSKFLKLALCLGLFAGVMNNDGWSMMRSNKNNNYHDYEQYNTLSDDTIDYDKQKEKMNFEMKKSAGIDKYDKYHNLLSQIKNPDIDANSMRDTREKIEEELEQEYPNDRLLQKLYKTGYEQFNKADELYRNILTHSKIVKEAQTENAKTRIFIENQIKTLNDQLAKLALQSNIIQEIEEEHKTFMEKNGYRNMFGEYRMSRQGLKQSLDKLKKHLNQQRQSDNGFFDDMEKNPRYNPKQDMSMVQNSDEQYQFNKNNKEIKKIYNKENNYNKKFDNIEEEDNNILDDNIITTEIQKTDKNTKNKTQQKQIDVNMNVPTKTINNNITEKEDDKDNSKVKEKNDNNDSPGEDLDF